MIEIEKPNISSEEMDETGKSGVFVVEPLERGYGMTLGNSLRRVLLSSLPGVAVTSIKIDGVLHEISAIPGVKEDVTEIVLNVKGITAKLYSPTPKTVYIDVNGSRDITARDIVCDSDIEILNPDHHIATLCENAHFYMELTFDHGRGYVSNDKNNTYSPTINIIPITTKMNKRKLPVHVELWNYQRYGLKAPSTLMVEQTTTVALSSLDKYIGKILDKNVLGDISRAMRVQFPVIAV